MENLKNLETASKSFSIEKYSTEEYKGESEVRDLTHSLLKSYGITDAKSLFRCLRNAGNFFPIHVPNPPPLTTKKKDCIRRVLNGRITKSKIETKTAKSRRTILFPHNIFLHFSQKENQLYSLIPSEKLKTSICLEYGCRNESSPKNGNLSCDIHSDTNRKNKITRMPGMWPITKLISEESKDSAGKFKKLLSNQGEHVRQKLIFSACHKLLGKKKDETDPYFKLITASEWQEIKKRLQAVVHDGEFLQLAYDIEKHRIISKFVDQRDWYWTCEHVKHSFVCANQANTGFSTHCKKHEASVATRRLKNTIVEIVGANCLEDLNMGHFRKIESKIKKDKGGMKISGGLLKISRANKQLYFEKKSSGSTSTTYFCRNFFKGCHGQSQTSNCIKCDNKLGWIALLLKVFPPSNTRSTRGRNLDNWYIPFHLTYHFYKKHGGVKSWMLSKKLLEYGLPPESRVVEVLTKKVKKWADVISWKCAFAVYAQIESADVKADINIAATDLRFGNVMDKLAKILKTQKANLAPMLEPPKMVDRSKYIFSLLEEGEKIPRIDGCSCAIYKISHKLRLLVYIGKDSVKSGKGWLRVERLHSAKNDKTAARRIPNDTDRRICHIAKVTGQINPYAVETIIMLAYLTANSMAKFTEEKLVNIKSSSFLFPQTWFAEMQRFQFHSFGSYVALKKDDPNNTLSKIFLNEHSYDNVLRLIEERKQNMTTE